MSALGTPPAFGGLLREARPTQILFFMKSALGTLPTFNLLRFVNSPATYLYCAIYVKWGFLKGNRLGGKGQLHNITKGGVRGFLSGWNLQLPKDQNMVTVGVTSGAGI